MKRNISILGSDLFMHAWNDKKLFSHMTGFDTYVSNFEFIESDAWFDMDWFQEVIEGHWKDKPETFYHFTKNGYHAGEAFVRFCRNMNIEVNDQHALELLFLRSAKLYQALSVFIPITHPLSKLIEKKVIGILQGHGIPDAGMDQALVAVSTPDKINGPEQEIIDLEKIKHRMHEPSFDTEEALRKHWEKYSYLGYRNLFSPGYPLEFFQSRLNDQNLDNMGISHQPSIGIEFTPSEQQAVDLLKEFVWFRNYRTEKLFEGLFFLEPLWKKLSASHRLGEEDIFYYLVAEVTRLFTHGDKLPGDELELRKHGSALLLDDNHFLLLTGDLLKQKEAALQEVQTGTVREIKGMVVCRGTARGPVCIVRGNQELEKVHDGDILVTNMTTPDYLPALQKASAFVTDEGGITCHAAIVARELKKPCIVGTRNATQWLKDGETVEVDANQGVVNIVN